MVNHTMSRKNELKEPKTASSKAPIDLSADIELTNKIEKLIAYWKQFENYSDEWFLFNGPTPISAHALENAKNKYLKLAGIEQHIRLHDFRHSCASWLFSIGIPITVISKILRHTNINETMKTYTHLLDTDYTMQLNNIKNFKENN